MSSPVSKKPIDPILFEWRGADSALKASCCLDCGQMAFPARESCMACGGTSVEINELPKAGKLWTFTIQAFMPKAPYNSDETPETFRPFGVGYVELPGALRIETRIPLSEEKPLAIGLDMELFFYTHRTEADGTEIINYAFRPV